jgi:quercetin dioxygenase-like cupin family protein
MKVKKAGSSPSSYAPDSNFTGTVRRDPLIAADAPGRANTGMNTFEPGARTAWHVHPAGQILIVIAGCGWVRAEGGPKVQVTPGDSVFFAAGEKHWHGATANTAMTHIAVTEYVDGEGVTWLEHVSDEDYLAD